MKKAALIILSLFILLCSCTPYEADKNTNTQKRLITGVWISCYELNTMLDTGDFKKEFDAAAEKIHRLHITDAFVHVRAFGESLFDSEYYPRNEKTKQYDFDVLEYMIKVLKGKNIRMHAWINPFRLPDGSFSDPADETVRANIILGIREILNKYDVDGIHFDDYFYPSDGKFSDEKSYSDYQKSGKDALSLSEYRTANINALVFSAKSAIKHMNPDLVFSISPAADMEKNKNQAFADIPYWCESGAVDLIMPQLYFGFDYPDDNFKFEKLLNEWRKIPRAEGVKMVIGLASYKLGTDTAPDTDEWKNGTDVLAREINKCKEFSDISGICFFSYSSLFAGDKLHTEALSAIKRELV